MDELFEKIREKPKSFYIEQFDFKIFYPHWHISVELLYNIKGEITVGINENRIILSTGDLLVCGSNEIHYYESNKCEGLMCVFHPDLIGFPQGWPEEGFVKHLVIRRAEMTGELLATLAELKQKLHITPEHISESGRMLLQSILYKLCGMVQNRLPCGDKSNTIKRQTLNRKRVQQAADYIRRHYNEDLDLHAIASHLNISPYYISHMFKQILGITIPKFINAVRVENAEIDIVNSDKKFLDIALEQGFKSLRTFNRSYKEYKGCTPSEKRKISSTKS